MHDDKQSPATKEDVQGIMEYLARNESKIFNVGKNLEELEGQVERMEKQMQKDKEEIKHHFDVVAENLVYDFKGALNDKIQNHENRIAHIEEHVGLVA